MPRILVLYYSSYGHIETMAEAVAEGARAAGATVDIKFGMVIVQGNRVSFFTER